MAGRTPARLRRFTADQKQAILKAFETWEGPMETFCARHEVSSSSLCAWRRAYQALGAQALEGRKVDGGAVHHGPYTPEQRQQAVEAFRKSGMSADVFARVWKVTPHTLRDWTRRYEAEGARGLLLTRRGSPRGHPPLSAAVTERIVAVKRAFPEFGFKRVRGFLGRFRGLKVSVGSVRKSVRAAGLAPTPGTSPRRKKAIRFFERAAPGALWQSDWTSFVLPRTSQRVYLIAFLDDHSRYVVSWGLHTGQRTEHVIEALREGMTRFGKPVEVLTDQGPQYYSWRGTSEFQQFLKAQGIKHLVARSHHPQTLGKCERFWGTVAEEFWGRIPPVELAEVRVRFAHFVAHYNHFRPHQGIANLVPADKFFGAETSVRQALEQAYARNELHLAVDEAPRQPFYLTGQIGEVPVALVGEKGKLVFHGADGRREEVPYDALGMGPGARKEGGDGDGGGGKGQCGGGAEPAGAAGPGGAAEGDVQAAAAGGAGEGVAVEREPGGTAAGARAGDRDPVDVAGAQDAGGGGEGAGAAGGAGETALGGGAVGDGGGAAQAAEDDAERRSSPGGGSGDAEEADRGSGEGDAGAAGAGEDPAGAAGEQGAGEGAGA